VQLFNWANTVSEDDHAISLRFRKYRKGSYSKGFRMAKGIEEEQWIKNTMDSCFKGGQHETYGQGIYAC